MQETILITSNAYFPNIGGVENSLRYLANSYTDMGYKVLVVVSEVSIDGKTLPTVEVIDNVTIYRYSSFAHLNGIRKCCRSICSAFNAWTLLRKLRRNNNIILTLSRFHTTTLLAKLAKLPNIIYLVPGVVKNQNNSTNLVKNSGINKLKLNLSLTLHHFIQKNAFRHCDQVFVFSQNMVKQIADVLPALGNIPIVKPGVDSERFYPANNKLELRSLYKVPTDKIVLLTVGRFVRAKGFELVIEAMKKLPQCHLVMVGDGENMSVIKQKIKTNNLDNQVSLVGSQSNTVPYYQLADIFLMSSTYEPLGQTILEALSTELPIVAFKGNSVTTATQELLSENEAVYTDNITSDGLIASINKLTNTQSLMDDLSAQGRTIATARFSWQTLAKQILDFSCNDAKHS